MNTPPPLPKKKAAVFHHPLGFELYDGLAMDLHAMTYAEPMLKEIERLRKALTTSIATLERDGDEWGICEHLRAALTPNAK